MPLKTSGKKTTYATGASRDHRDGKGFFHCIPYEAMLSLAKQYEAGAPIYGKQNWKKGVPLSNFIDSIMRHTMKIANNWHDENHAGAILWNASGLIWTVEAIKRGQLPESLDDIGYFASLPAT